MGGMIYRLARDGIADAWPAAWPGWSFVRMSCARTDLPLLVKGMAGTIRAAHRMPRIRADGIHMEERNNG
jgi:hypothetical protein